VGKEAQPKEIIIYANQDGYEPFAEFYVIDKENDAYCNAYAALNKAIMVMLRP
jgi:hypothetical protein